MAILEACAVPSVMAKDPRFQALKEAYKDKHYSDDHLAQALQLCREYHDYDYDWYPETPAQRGVFTRFMNYYLMNAKIARTDSEMTKDSLYNLYTTLYALYTPEQLDSRISMLARDFRERLDKLEKDNPGKTRQEIIRDLGIGEKNGFVKIMQSVFNIYEKNYANADAMMAAFDKKHPEASSADRENARKRAEYRAQEYKTILANRERLSALAASRIGEEEGFVVKMKDLQVIFEDPSESDMSDNDEATNETTAEDREEGSKGERYSDFRLFKLMNTLSVRARRLISKIPKVDSNGKIIRDDLGVMQYVSGRQVAVILKRVLVNSTPESMMSDLENAANFNPWIRGLINALNEDKEARTTIYSNFKNAETTYVYVDFDKGKYSTHIANSRSAGYAMMREAGNNLRAGYVQDESTSLYTGYGALRSLEAVQKIRSKFSELKKLIQSDEGTMWIRMVDGDKVSKGKYIDDIIENGRKEGKNLEYLRLPGTEAMSAFLAQHPTLASDIASLLRGMGFSVSEKDIKTIATQTMTPKSFGFLAGFWKAKSVVRGRNKLYQLVDFMDGVYKRAEDILSSGQVATGQYLFNTSDGFMRINRCLSLAQYKDVDARVVSEGKSLSTYNHVNLLHQVFDALMNRAHRSEEEYQKMLEEDYLQYEGMALGTGEKRQVYGWLRRLRDNVDGIREKMRVIDVSAFNHVEYARMSRPQKLTSSLVMYLEAGNTFQEDKYAAYEVPIQSDYSTAYNFILAPRLSADGNDSPVINAIVNEVLLELDRISAIERRALEKIVNENGELVDNPNYDPNRVKLSVYEKQGMKFQIFPAFNDNGFREQYTQLKANPEEAYQFVHDQVVSQLEEVIRKDRKTIEDSGILMNVAFKKVNFGYGNTGSLYSKTGKVSELNEDGQEKLREFFLNVFYARLQTIKLLTGGIEQFNGLIDYEKRNMLTHATRSALYTEATWKGQKVGKETQNVVYIGDDSAKSAFLSDISEMLTQLLDAGVVSKSQYDSMVDAYSKIKTTDGQGMRTLESYRTVQIMADSWDDVHENAYKNIMKGKATPDDVAVFMQNIKPVLTGYEHVPAAKGSEQKPVKLTVLHKYSEQVLLPLALAKSCIQAQSTPFRGLEMAQKQLKKEGREIDMFLFHSGVKVGAHSILQPFAKDKDGKRILTSSQEISDYIVSGVRSNVSTIHTLPFKYYGIAASTPAHVADDKIAWASQAEKVAWANIMKGQKITVRGKEMDAWDARELYFSIKTANIIEAYKKLRELFANTDELERVFQEELASKAYSSRELMYALAHLKDGTFAVPLFSPNVEHQVQELLASIIKKRLTKPKVKGANILQATGLGMDIEISAYDNEGLSEDDKLHVVFEGTGKDKRIKYVEVFMPLHDERLKAFAKSDGTISPDSLKDLERMNVIPESMLEFIAYRTPSDAEHSVIPCRIKGFIANTGGATIMMPKEIMVMTGHDYDGDKMRCHFKNFTLGYSKERIRAVYEKYLENVDSRNEFLKRLNIDEEKAANFDEFYEAFIQPANKQRDNYRKCEVYEYDYDKSALENSQEARNNARVELMFSELTSPAGSQRMLIPGGCDDTKIVAKSMYITRAAKDEKVRARLEELLGHSVDEPASLYDTLIRKSDGKLSDIIREISSYETPYTLTHSADAFDYVMGGAELIGIYALYNSAFQMLQRLDMSYVPKLTQKGKPYNVSILGNNYGKLFDIENHRGRLASLSLARLLNAAVDNNKDPVLGFLNQTKEMSEMTFLMLAAGNTEEEVHLIMNQPAIVELINRLKSRNNEGLRNEALKLVAELAGNNSYFESYVDPKSSQWVSLQHVSEMRREDFTSTLATNYKELVGSEDLDMLTDQISVLQTLVHLNTAASNLATFVRLTRPESESGSIGTTVASIVTKVIELNAFREKLRVSDDNDIRISGMYDVLKWRDVHEGWDTSYIEEILGLNLPEVVALNSLMVDSSLEMFKPYFPQAKSSWVELAADIAGRYNYKSIQEGIVQRIGEEMILWKLLSNKTFIGGNPQEEQRRIIIDVPKQLKDLKERIANVKNNPGSDGAAAELIGNAFIDKLSTTSPENSNEAPRLMFTLNGAAVEGTSDLIRASWGAMLTSSDKQIRDLAIDLFKYNLYTNGFSYGMYEFSHFAPFSVLMSTPGYIEALQDVMKTDWNDNYERENFVNQYYLNHWGDSKFLPKLDVNKLKFANKPEDVKSQLWLSYANEPDTLVKLQSAKYVVLQGTDSQALYRVESGNADAACILVFVKPVAVRNRNMQVTLQYNPTVDYHFMEPVVAGNESAWGQLDTLNVYAEANINSTVNVPQDTPVPTLGLGFFGLGARKEQIEGLEKEAEKDASGNTETLANAPKENTPPVLLGTGAFGLSVDTNALRQAAVDYNKAENEGKMLKIARRYESGKIETDTVPATPANIREARKQQVFIELNKKLRDILRSKGVGIGVLTDTEAMMSLGGVTDFDTANVTAEGLLEMIRLANGWEGEIALPEEFAHMALEMLGHEHPLVVRLLNVLRNSDEALREAYEGDYDEYVKQYGEDNRDKLVLEAAGKLVAKQLLRNEPIQTSPVRRLLDRIVDAIKSLLRLFSRDEVQNAIFDANEVASKLAREMLGGRLLDQMALENVGSSDKFYSVKKDLTGKHDILSELLKTETKRLSILKKRIGHTDKNTTPLSVKATEQQIAKLESAIRNYKAEDAVVTYLSDSLEFLKATEKSLNDAIESGRPMNSVCQKLNTVRDTLYSFAKSIEDIRKAITAKEIQDSENLTLMLAQVSEVVSRFFTVYDTKAREYFEEMLSSVYGEHGKTITIGRQKGRVISIHDMATMADGDISLASRWFYSIADCNDYVLKAVDDITRDAKVRARRKAATVRPRIEAAIAELIRETGSRDQSFMFAMEKGEDGKMHRTGKYITEKQAKTLPKAQQKFYNEMMAIKKDADTCIPSSLVEDNLQIVMVRKYTMDRYKDAEGAKGKAIEAWEGLKNRVMDMSDDFDPENHEVVVDFQGNKVDMLPVKFVKKGKSESFDDMTDDVASSMMAYAGMAYEYNEMNGIVNIIENAKYMAAERDVVQKTGRRTQRESIDTDNASFREPFTKKAAGLNAQKALEDFVSMHIYGHTAANEGTFGKTRISKRKVVDTINGIVSLSQMALNLPQRIANVATGGVQVVVESAGNGVFNTKDVTWASSLWMKESGDRLAETGKTDYSNKLSLWDEYFDIHQNNGRDVAKYKKGRMSRIFNSSLLYAGLTIGEDYLASVASLAAARNFKVKDGQGQTKNLWDAYEVRYHDSANETGAYLALKDGYTKMDGSPITAEDEKNFSKRVIGLNFDMQGIYNLDDRSAVQQYAFGALIIMYRKWIAPAIKRRYGATQYSALKGKDEEGYYRTLFRTLYDTVVDAKDAVTESEGSKALMNILEDIKALKSAYLLNKSKLSDYELSNMRRAWTELGIVAGLFLSTALLLRLPPNDHDGNETLTWLDNFVMSQLLRLRAEIGAQAPTPMFVGEALRILKSPFAAIGPIKSTLNVFQLLLPYNYFTEIKSGKYKGHVKAYKYFREFPIISMFKKVDNFIDPTPLIQYYQNDSQF